MLDKEFKYYLENQSSLVKEYNGKFIVIKDQKVVGSYNNQGEAYENAAKNFQVGTFLIQRFSPGNTDYTQSFYSRVHFH